MSMKSSICTTCIVVAATALSAAPAVAWPTHLHCMTTPNGQTHAIAQGVTLQAPHDPALHNFHSNVHAGAFAGNNPHTLSADVTPPYGC